MAVQKTIAPPAISGPAVSCSEGRALLDSTVLETASEFGSELFWLGEPQAARDSAKISAAADVDSFLKLIFVPLS